MAFQLRRRGASGAALLLGLAALLSAADAISVIVPAHEDECFYEQVRRGA
jgi:NAD(P)H-hydrate repair Nnr-like enzyme with NAD(P)H-hydrate dehydratase domain